MPNRRTILLIGLSLFLLRDDTAQAESTHERVTLMLSGPDCPSIRQRITTALHQQPGVLNVDPDLMPDHVLVDIVQSTLTDTTLAATAHTAIAGARCRAEIMKSCITAGPSSHHTDPP
ncbi:MAG: cation transporter [Nitrospira sp.]|nr:cation transporter [Nitrospira sp.]